MSKIETIPVGKEFNRQEYFDQLLEDNYQVYAGRAEVSPDNKEKNSASSNRRGHTCEQCPQPFHWLSKSEIILRSKQAGGFTPNPEIGEDFVMSNYQDGEWLEWGSLRSWQRWKNPVVTTEYFYTTRCTPCDSKYRRVKRAQHRIEEISRAVGYTKFVTLTKPVIPFGTVPTNSDIQDAMKEHARIMRNRLSSRRVMLKKAVGPSTFGYYWLECVVRAYQDDNFEQEVDHDDPDAKVWTLHPHIHAVWSASKKKWNLDTFRKWWSPKNENWRSEVQPYSTGEVADYVTKKSVHQTMVEYVDKQATYWDTGFRTCNKFGKWRPSASSRRRMVRSWEGRSFDNEKLTSRENKFIDDQISTIQEYLDPVLIGRGFLPPVSDHESTDSVQYLRGLDRYLGYESKLRLEHLLRPRGQRLPPNLKALLREVDPVGMLSRRLSSGKC